MSSGRVARVQALAALVRREAPRLTAEATEWLEAPGGVIQHDIALTVRRLEALPALAPAMRGRRPLGTVAISLPGNAILSNPLMAIGVSFLAGNRAIVRLPRRRAGWSTVVEDLVERTLGPDVRWSNHGGPRFVQESALDPEVQALVAFGGDEWAGYEELARRSGTKVVFEGPGKDPFLVLEGADPHVAARAAVRSGCYNSGQACTSTERLYVVDTLFDPFVESLVVAAESVCVGDRRDPATEVAALEASTAARISRQLDEALSGGATLLTGGADGNLVRPTVLVDVAQEMEVMQEESFGPLLPVARVATTHEAISLAEDSSYGLTATVFGGPATVATSLQRTHGVVHRGETWLDRRWNEPLAPGGGRRRSGWVWEWVGEDFVRRDGPRRTVMELSRAGES